MIGGLGLVCAAGWLGDLRCVGLEIRADMGTLSQDMCNWDPTIMWQTCGANHARIMPGSDPKQTLNLAVWTAALPVLVGSVWRNAAALGHRHE